MKILIPVLLCFPIFSFSSTTEKSRIESEAMTLVFGKYESVSKRSPFDFKKGILLYDKKVDAKYIKKFYGTPVFFDFLSIEKDRLVLIFSILGDESEEGVGTLTCNYCTPVLGYAFFTYKNQKLKLLSKDLKFTDELGGGGRPPTNIKWDQKEKNSTILIETDYSLFVSPDRGKQIRKAKIKGDSIVLIK